MKIKIIQTCDSISKYTFMLDITSNINKKYCEKNNYDYYEYRGIKRGQHPWHSTFNRMYLIEEEFKNDFDWVVYIDADVIITDFNVKIEEIINDYNNKNKVIILFGYGEPHEHTCVNAGIFLYNMKHEFAKSFMNIWKSFFEIMIDNKTLENSTAPWSVRTEKFIIDDQMMLTMMIYNFAMLDKIDDIMYRYSHKDSNKFIGRIFHQEMRPNMGKNGVYMDERIINLIKSKINIENKNNIKHNNTICCLNNANLKENIEKLEKESNENTKIIIFNKNEINLTEYLQKLKTITNLKMFSINTDVNIQNIINLKDIDILNSKIII